MRMLYDRIAEKLIVQLQIYLMNRFFLKIHILF